MFLFGWLQARVRISPRVSAVLVVTISVFLFLLQLSYNGVSQFIQAGADTGFQCEDLARIVSASADVPPSPFDNARPAVACARELHGMFLTPYYVLRVFGVTAPDAQTQKNLSSYRRQSEAYPLRVEFCELNYWIVRNRGAVTTTERGPGKLLNAVNIR